MVADEEKTWASDCSGDIKKTSTATSFKPSTETPRIERLQCDNTP